MTRIRIGTSGFSYPHWRGVFYPRGLSPTGQLRFASERFDSIEIHRSFYSLVTPDVYQSWYEQTGRDFRFGVKGGRFITHMKKLRDVETALANFFASGVLALREKLGPIVWQLPEALAFDPEKTTAFFQQLPKTTSDAAELARRHDRRLRAPAFTTIDRNRRIRHAIEPRHESFFCPRFAALAERYGIALVIADSAAWPLCEELTASFVYLRLHGHHQTYGSRYSAAELDHWAARIKLWALGQEPCDARRLRAPTRPQPRSRDVYVYFDNDAHAYAAHNALELRARILAKDVATHA